MRILLSLLAVGLICGCGSGVELPELGTVTGTVTNGGVPVANAVVTFSPTGKGRPSVGTTDSDGNYSLLYNIDTEGAMIGQHIVGVDASGSGNEDCLLYTSPSPRDRG